jgi:beta-1,4-mannosyl-glycoprotein beta-1,4-N-acetylglucosaminyltransferase
MDLLTYRLNILADVVDYFVIVESTHTFTGKEKPLYFNEHKHAFEKFKDKIVHIIVDDFPHKNIIEFTNKQWENEFYQRNAISRGLARIHTLKDDDVIIISDVDEIPDPRTLRKIRQGEIIITFNILEMDFYYYNLNTKISDKWYHCKIISYKQYTSLHKSCNDIRMSKPPRIANGGWHLSYFGDVQFIKNKINTFSHQELNIERHTNVATIEERIKNSVDLYGRNVKIDKLKIKDNTYLPVEYDTYLTKYFTV